MDRVASHNTVRVVRAARRRMLAAALLEASGRCLSWGVAIGLVGVLAVKFLALPAPMWVVLAVPLAVGAVIGAGIACRRRGTSLAAASEVDRRLGLKDRLATATALKSRITLGDAFVVLAMDDAEAASASVNLRAAVPVRLGRAWAVWPAVLAASIAAAVFVPRVDVLSRSGGSAGATRAASERIQTKLSDIRKQAQTPPESPSLPVDPKSVAESARVLEEVRKELAAGTTSPQVAAERGARELDKLAQQRDRAAEAAERQRDSVQDAMRELPQHSPADAAAETELSRALRAGDFAEASLAAKDLLNSEGTDASGAEQRAKAAKELEQLARDLRAAGKAMEDAKRSAKHHASGPNKVKEPSARPPTDAEHSDKADGASAPSVQPDHATEDLAKSLERAAEAIRREQGQPPRDVSKPDAKAPRPDAPPHGESSREPPAPNQDQQSGPADTKQSADKAKADSAEQKKERPAESTQGDKSSSGKQDSRQEAEKSQQGATDAKPEPASDEKPPSASERQGDAPPRESDQPGKPDPTTGAQDKKPATFGKPDPSASGKAEPKPSQSPDDKAKPDERDNPSPDATTGKPRPGDADSPSNSGSKGPVGSSESQSGKPDSKPQTQAGDSRSDSQGKRPSPSDPGASDPFRPSGPERVPAADAHTAGKGNTPGTDKQTDPGSEDKSAPLPSGSKQPSSPNQEPQPGPLPEPSREDIKKLADQLQKLANAPKDAAASRQQSQALRKQADELLRSATPEQREQMQRWAQEVAKEMRDRSGSAPPQPEEKGRDGAGSGAGDPTARAPTPALERTETVDARTPPRPPDDPSHRRERVIAEWYSDRPVDRNSSSSSSPISPEGQELAKEAAREGERALETQIVPSRFDRLLQRYFQRLPQRAGAPATPATSLPDRPVEPAKDAPGAAAP